jgi:hypothetical protein
MSKSRRKMAFRALAAIAVVLLIAALGGVQRETLAIIASALVAGLVCVSGGRIKLRTTSLDVSSSVTHPVFPQKSPRRIRVADGETTSGEPTSSKERRRECASRGDRSVAVRVFGAAKDSSNGR